MRILKNSFWLGLLLISGCGRELTDDFIPITPFPDIVINLSLPANNSLQVDGGNLQLSSGGIRGIILYRINSSTYMAYERNCSFRPNEACATVDAHSSGLFMIDSCCNSNFSFTDGSPTGGPAWRPLNRYRTQLSGITLTITDEVIN
jgi:nitrite reductase/ring-hydroxylating ferredoxin subunit